MFLFFLKKFSSPFPLIFLSLLPLLAADTLPFLSPLLQKIDVQSETLLLDSVASNVSPADIHTAISTSEPRYSLYRYPGHGGLIFMYSCPTASKIKERMVYAASRARMLGLAEQEAGLTIAKKLEASSPEEWTDDVLASEFAEKKIENKGFARPKRPGRR